jgi:hypothetical protein
MEDISGCIIHVCTCWPRMAFKYLQITYIWCFTLFIVIFGFYMKVALLWYQTWYVYTTNTFCSYYYILKKRAWLMTSINKNAQGCQGGTHQILKLDTLSYHFLQKNRIHTLLYAYAQIACKSTWLVGLCDLDLSLSPYNAVNNRQSLVHHPCWMTEYTLWILPDLPLSFYGNSTLIRLDELKWLHLTTQSIFDNGFISMKCDTYKTR